MRIYWEFLWVSLVTEFQDIKNTVLDCLYCQGGGASLYRRQDCVAWPGTCLSRDRLPEPGPVRVPAGTERCWVARMHREHVLSSVSVLMDEGLRKSSHPPAAAVVLCVGTGFTVTSLGRRGVFYGDIRKAAVEAWRPFVLQKSSVSVPKRDNTVNSEIISHFLFDFICPVLPFTCK